MKVIVILTFISIFGLAFSDEINGDNRNSTDIEEADEVESNVDDPTHRLCRSNFNLYKMYFILKIVENIFNHQNQEHQSNISEFFFI